MSFGDRFRLSLAALIKGVNSINGQDSFKNGCFKILSIKKLKSFLIFSPEFFYSGGGGYLPLKVPMLSLAFQLQLQDIYRENLETLAIVHCDVLLKACRLLQLNRGP